MRTGTRTTSTTLWQLRAMTDTPEPRLHCHSHEKRHTSLLGGPLCPAVPGAPSGAPHTHSSLLSRVREVSEPPVPGLCSGRESTGQETEPERASARSKSSVHRGAGGSERKVVCPLKLTKAFAGSAFSPSLHVSQMFLFHSLPPPPILYVADGLQTNQGAEAAKNLKKKKDSETHIFLQTLR